LKIRELIIDLVAFVALGVLAGVAFGIDCYTDPLTGRQICTLETQRTDTGPYVRATARDTEMPLPIWMQGSDSGTGTLIYDDGRRAIVLTCWHNIRNTRPPYEIWLPPRGEWRPAKILDSDPDNELAALEIAGGTGIQPIEIFDGPLPRDLRACGFGSGKEGYRFACVTGQLTSTPYTQPGQRGFLGQVRQGDSGGGVTTLDGKLVGVLWGNNVEYSQVMFTCDQPLRRFLDRILPGRPGVVIPHARYTQPYTRPTIQQPQGGSRLPGNMPAARPQAAVTTAPTSAPAGTNTPIPKPASVIELPPYRLPPVATTAPPAVSPPDVPPLNVSGTPGPPPAAPSTTPPAATVATTPPAGATGPSVYSPAPSPQSPVPAVFDGAGTWLVTKGLATLGIPGAIIGIAAPIIWKLARRGLKKEADQLKAKLQAKEATSPVGATDPSEESFHISQTTSGGELLERDTREAEELLRLRRLEGRDPFQESIRGGLVEDLLENLAESTSDPQRAQFARDLQYELQRKFNKICPTKLKAAV
jgi:hypothetical protein